MDLLLERTEPQLVDWQLDIYWAVDGGADPMSLLAEVGGRVTSVHVKDRTVDGRMVDVGDGVIDFGTVLRAAEGRSPPGLPGMENCRRNAASRLMQSSSSEHDPWFPFRVDRSRERALTSLLAVLDG